jgi:dTDP-glucose 4,6-dehydratase
VVYFPLPINDPLQQPDITKKRKLLGWEAKVNRAEEDYVIILDQCLKKSFKEEHKDFSKYIS